tara:strand:- start:274 stop:618 length:345 start_codon:yes stop_codon:yes gene_type:complete
MDKIYIAGPMRHYKEFNFPAFFIAENHLLLTHGEDTIIFNPARHDEDEYGLDVTGLKGDMSEIPDFQFRDALRWDMNRICDSDAIYMLKGWENSAGARAEHALACVLWLRIIYE